MQLDGYSASIVTLEAYDETYGIADYSYDDPRNPMALIAMHPKEDYLTNGRMERTIKSYAKYRVLKHYGISLLEFLDLPRHISQVIMDDCLEREKSEGKKAEELLNGLGGN